MAKFHSWPRAAQIGFIKPTRQRDAPDIANDVFRASIDREILGTSLPVGLRPLPLFISAVRSPSTDVEDGRSFNPEWVGSPGRSTRRPHSPVVLAQPSRSQRRSSPAQRWGRDFFRFKAPYTVQICLRRKVRSEVLHAIGLTGRRGVARLPRKRSQWSEIGC